MIHRVNSHINVFDWSPPWLRKHYCPQSSANIQGSGLYVPPAPFEVQGLVCTGQSNTWGARPGSAGVSAAILYWDTDATSSGAVHSSFWHPLHGQGVHLPHGADNSMGQHLIANGGNVYTNHSFILCVAYGSSFYSEWQPGSPGGAPVFNAVKTVIQQAMGLIAAQFPDHATYKLREIRNLGQSDQTVNSLVYQQGWAAGQTSWHTQLQSMIAAVLAKPQTWKPSIIVQSSPLQSTAHFVPTTQDQQLASAGDSDHLVIPDPALWQPNYIHLNDAGYVDLGIKLGTQILYLDSIGQ